MVIDIDRVISEIRSEVHQDTSFATSGAAPEFDAMLDALQTLRTEVNLSHPNVNALSAYLAEALRHKAAIDRRAIEDMVSGRAPTIFGNPETMMRITQVFDALTAEIVAAANHRAEELNRLAGMDAALTEPVDTVANAGQDTPMTSPTREEIDAKLETIEARMDGRVAAIQASIDGFMGRMDERFRSMDDRMGRIEEDSRETKAAVSNLKSTMIVTAVSTVLAIVLGVAAFNATVLSNMVASFESGKNTAAAQAELKRQSEETAALLKQIQSQLPASPAAQQHK